MVDNNLVKWLTSELEVQGWSMRELARRAGVSHTTISFVLSQQQRPTWDFCAAIARALKVPEDDVFVRAGLKRAPPEPVKEEYEALGIFRGLPQQSRSTVLAMLRGLAGQEGLPSPGVAEPAVQYATEEEKVKEEEQIRETVDALQSIWRELSGLDPDALDKLLNVATIQAEMVLAAARSAEPKREASRQTDT